jgi:hypothetical protein
MTEIIVQLTDDKGEVHGLLEKEVPSDHLPQVLVPGMTLVFPAPKEDYLELTAVIVEWMLPGTGLDDELQPGYRAIVQYAGVDDPEDLEGLYDFFHIYGFHRTKGFLDSEEREKVRPLPMRRP